MANLITAVRVLCSLIIIFTPIFSPLFYLLYLAAGLSDVIDGAAARRLKQVSEFGARFDTTADMIFFWVVFVKIALVGYIFNWMWILIAIIAIIKVTNIVLGLMYQRKLVAKHTVLNKITGTLIFLIVLFVSMIPKSLFNVAAALICIIAAFASIQEFIYIQNDINGLN